MGCCKGRIIENPKKEKIKNLRKKNSIILDKISKVADFKRKYEYLAMLGSGGFGKVRLFRDK